MCQVFEKDNLGLMKNYIKNKKIEKEVLEQKGKIFYIPKQFWSYNLAEREIRYVVSGNNSPRTKEKMRLSLIMAELRFAMTV